MLGAPPGAGLVQGDAALSPVCSPPMGALPGCCRRSGRESPWDSATFPRVGCRRCGSLGSSGACRLPSSCPAPHGSQGTDTADRGGFGAGGCWGLPPGTLGGAALPLALCRDERSAPARSVPWQHPGAVVLVNIDGRACAEPGVPTQQIVCLISGPARVPPGCSTAPVRDEGLSRKASTGCAASPRQGLPTGLSFAGLIPIGILGVGL